MIKCIRNLAELQAVAQEWNALPGACRNPLLAHEWILSAAESFHTDGELRILALIRDNRLSAVAPLALTRARGIRRLEFIGSSRLYEPAGFLYENLESLHKLCNALTSLKHPVKFQRIAEPAEVTDFLAIMAKGRGHIILAAASTSPYLTIRTPWDLYFASISSRRRYDFRRVRTRLSVNGEVSVDIRNPTMEILPELMEEALRVESSGWKGRRGSGLLTSQKLRHFFTTYTVRACQLGILRLCFLRVNGSAIAMQIAVQYANRWWVLKIGYDEQWADYSPGMQLMMETVRHAFENGLEGYEFLGTSESWLRIWSQEEHSYPTFSYYPRTIPGTSALAIDTLAQVAKHIIRTASRANSFHK
jgi:CelD/BcsL family acetyltransferase involved in cellulose biosynthesis